MNLGCQAPGGVSAAAVMLEKRPRFDYSILISEAFPVEGANRRISAILEAYLSQRVGLSLYRLQHQPIPHLLTIHSYS